MEFLQSSDKIRRLRRQLGLTQDDLQTENVTRGLISMIETGKRELTYSVAIKLSDKFNTKALELGLILNIDADYLIRTPRQDAELYCLSQLKNEDISMSTINSLLQLCDDYDLVLARAKALFRTGKIKEKLKEYEEASEKYDEAIKLFKDNKKENELAEIYLRLGSCKDKTLKYDTAIVYYNLSQYYSFVYNNKVVERLSLYNLSIEYKKIGKLNLALENVEKYLALSDESDPYYYFGLNTKANRYSDMGEYDKAIAVYMDLLEKISNTDKPILGYVYNNLGLNYCYKYNFKESLKYFQLAKDFISKTDKTILSHTIIESANVFLKQNLHNEAINVINEGLASAIEFNDIEYIINGYYMLSEIYNKLNDLGKLEAVYTKLVKVLKTNKDINKVKAIYLKLALMYSKQNKQELCQKYLLLSNELN